MTIDLQIRIIDTDIDHLRTTIPAFAFNVGWVHALISQERINI